MENGLGTSQLLRVRVGRAARKVPFTLRGVELIVLTYRLLA